MTLLTRLIHKSLKQAFAKLPARLCGKLAEFVEGKPKLSTWGSFANWLEKQGKISESKQRWMPEMKGWKRFDSAKGDMREIIGHPVPGLFAGAIREYPSRTDNVTKGCPVHGSPSTDSREEAIEMWKQMTELLRRGGFHLGWKKYSSLAKLRRVTAYVMRSINHQSISQINQKLY